MGVSHSLLLCQAGADIVTLSLTVYIRIDQNGARRTGRPTHHRPAAASDLLVPWLFPVRVGLHHDGTGIRPYRLLPHGYDTGDRSHGIPRPYRASYWVHNATGGHILLPGGLQTERRL